MEGEERERECLKHVNKSRSYYLDVETKTSWWERVMTGNDAFKVDMSKAK